MAISADILRELHRIHRQLTDLRERLERGPKQIRAADGSVARLKAALDEIREGLTRARVQVDERQLQLKGREARIEDLQGKLNAANSNREYQTLKEQIAADKQANSVLEDEIFEGLEKIDELGAKVKIAEENLKRSEAEAAKVKNRVEGERAGLESERNRVGEELRGAESNLPEDFKVEYDRIAQARGEDALAQVDAEVCGSCYQTLTAQMMNELYLGKPLWCKNCGAVLYLKEGRSVGS